MGNCVYVSLHGNFSLLTEKLKPGPGTRVIACSYLGTRFLKWVMLQITTWHHYQTANSQTATEHTGLENENSIVIWLKYANAETNENTFCGMRYLSHCRTE